MLQYFIAEQTFLNIYFPSLITDTTHIPSPITLNKLFLSTWCAEGFIPTITWPTPSLSFFLNPSFQIIE